MRTVLSRVPSGAACKQALALLHVPPRLAAHVSHFRAALLSSNAGPAPTQHTGLDAATSYHVFVTAPTRRLAVATARAPRRLNAQSSAR